MKPLRIALWLLIAVICLLTFTGFTYWYKGSSNPHKKHLTKEVSSRSVVYVMLQQKAVSAKKFAIAKKFNQRICFLIDMDVASGSNRFFVYNMEKDSILDAGLVTHGRCNEAWLNGRKYSNVSGSGCTSPGRYKIGNSYSGRFGLAYKLHGLDSTNSNAYKRYVVLHSHECVPASEVDPLPICQSDGCPTVSPDFLQKLAGYINTSSKPVLLWIYE